MKQFNYCLYLYLVTFGFLSGCASQDVKSSAVPNPTGIIRNCTYTMGESACGKCYCLESPEYGCEIIDQSEVGDLAVFVGKQVSYQGTRDQNEIRSTKMCPHYIKLFKIKLLKE